MVASSTMPRGVGHSKLTPLLALQPNPALWPASVAALKAAKPAGLSEKTIDAIVAAIPTYTAWLATTDLVSLSLVSLSLPSLSSLVSLPSLSPTTQTTHTKPHKVHTVVFTGVRDKAFEAALQAAGHIIADSLTKKTTHLITATGAATTTKITRAHELGIPVLSLSDAAAILMS
jgi:NAD-dependent DNA ligase